MITLSIILAIIITTSFFIIRNLIIKNEKLEDFISKQSEAINACDQRLKQLDDKNKTAKLVRVPKFSEVPYPVIMEPNLVIEYYSR